MRLSSSRITALTHRPQQDFVLWDKAGTRPSLDLQFADRKDLIDATTGSNLVDFTRASSGTYVGSDGLIKTATTNEARFDHDPTTGESLGLLVEESRTNLLRGSEDVDYAGNVTKEITTSLNVATVTAPDGTTTADEIAPTATTDEHFIGYPVSVTSGTTYTLSAYVKPNGTDSVRIRFAAAGFSNENGSHVFSTNTTDSGTCDFKITSVANGWYRIQGTAVASSTGTGVPRIYPNQDNSWLGVPSEALYVWGAQLEEGSFPTSYIPTEGSTVTRAADVATDTSTGANIRTLYAEFRGPGLDTRPIVSLDDDTANERIELLTSGTDPKLLVTDGGSAVADIDAGTVTANTLAKLAARFATDDYAAAVDGGTLQTDTSGTLPTVDRIRIGSNQAGDYFTGTIARITGWGEDLPNTAVEGITQ